MHDDAPFSEFKWANFFLTPILSGQDLSAGKRTFDEFAFEVSKHGKMTLSDNAMEIIDECMFPAASPGASGLPGYRGRGPAI